MAKLIESNARLEINNRPITYYGNSVSYDLGLPDVNVLALSAGGGAIETAHGTDVTTGVSMVKFKLPSNGETNDLISEWKQNGFRNVCKLVDVTINEAMTNASCAEAREITLDSGEGGVEITFKGDPMRTIA